MAALLTAVMILLLWPGSASAAIPAFNKVSVDDQFHAIRNFNDNQGIIDFGDKDTPRFAQGYPKEGAKQPSGSKKVEVLIKADRSGTAYYLATRDRAQPAIDQIMTGKGYSGKPIIKTDSISISADVETGLLIELPDHAAAYNIYVVVKDLEGSFSRVKKVGVKTPPDTISSNAEVTSAIYTISIGETGHRTISNVPYGTSKEDFLNALTKGHPNQVWNVLNINDPVQSGDTLVVTAPDQAAQVTYNIIVDPLPELILSDHAFGNYQAGVIIPSVDFQTFTSGGARPYTYKVADGKLPSGLNLSDRGILSGTPNQAGKYYFTVKVSDSEGNSAANQYTLTVVPGITSFVLKEFDPDIVGDIDQILRTIKLTVPYSADVTRLVPTITHTAGSKVVPASGKAQNFTGPVVYTVEARDDTRAHYTVTVIKKASIPVASINVSGKNGETRVRRGSTLQMVVDIKPKDATDQTVTWKVIDGTGSATISSQGLLRAYSTGTVTVRAYAKDGSGVVGSRIISIYRSSSSSYYWDDWYYGDDWVDEDGGRIKDEGVTVVIPRNAVDSIVRINITKVSRSSVSVPKDMKLVSDVFNITKNVSGDFDRDVTIILPFDEDKLDRDSAKPSLYWWNGRRWAELDDIDVDWSDEKVSGKIDHFTRFAVLAAKIKPEPVKPEPKPETKKSTVILNDIYGHWAERPIRDLVSTGAISGYPDGCFRPNQSISRAEFAALLVKVMDIYASGEDGVFADTRTHWARYTIAAAYEAGIVSGYDRDTFGPDDPISREQMAVMIVRAAGLTNSNYRLNFADSQAISTWARSSVAQAAVQRIITGYPDNTFRPANPATRAEAVSIITRAFPDH